MAIICDRPTKLLFDKEGRLHGEATPALQFADEYSLYAYQGVILPVQYGVVNPSKWRAKWLLKNHSPELKQVLIQGIGDERLRQELTAEELTGVLGEIDKYTKDRVEKEKK